MCKITNFSLSKLKIFITKRYVIITSFVMYRK